MLYMKLGKTTEIKMQCSLPQIKKSHWQTYSKKFRNFHHVSTFHACQSYNCTDFIPIIIFPKNSLDAWIQ